MNAIIEAEKGPIWTGSLRLVFFLVVVFIKEYCALFVSPVVVPGDYPVPGKNFDISFISLASTWPR